MIIFLSSEGDILASSTEPIGRNSNDASQIYIVAPISSAAQIYLTFVLPNGEPLFGNLAEPTDRTKMQDARQAATHLFDVTDSNVNVWRYKVPAAVTQYSGTVQYDVVIVTESMRATAHGSFTVSYGNKIILPEDPTPDIWEKVHLAISSHEKTLEEKLDKTSVVSTLEDSGEGKAPSVKAVNEGLSNKLTLDKRIYGEAPAVYASFFGDPQATVRLVDFFEEGAIPRYRSEGALSVGDPKTFTDAVNIGTLNNRLLSLGNRILNLYIKCEYDNSAGELSVSLYEKPAQGSSSEDALISTHKINLPLEQFVQSGTMSDDGKKLILTLNTGDTVEIGVSEIVGGLATKNDLKSALSDMKKSAGDFEKNWMQSDEAQPDYIKNKPSIQRGEGENSILECGAAEASGEFSHAEGVETTASGKNAHAEGKKTIASGHTSHSEGHTTTANGITSHAEGYGTVASGDRSHAQGDRTVASALAAHAEGSGTRASELGAHAEGSDTVASGGRAHAEGHSTIASAWATHSEGYNTKATNGASHAEGHTTTASGLHSHSEGESSEAVGQASHAEGSDTQAIGNYSHAEGLFTVAGSYDQHVQGKFNVIDEANKYAHIVGNGSSKEKRSNAHTLDWQGNAWFAGDVKIGKDYALLATRQFVFEKIKELRAELGVKTGIFEVEGVGYKWNVPEGALPNFYIPTTEFRYSYRGGEDLAIANFTEIMFYDENHTLLGRADATPDTYYEMPSGTTVIECNVMSLELNPSFDAFCIELPNVFFQAKTIF